MVVKKDESALLHTVMKEADAKLRKDMVKLMHRIERVFVPSDSTTYNPIVERLAELMKSIQLGKYLVDVAEFKKEAVINVLSKNSELILRKVDWNEFQRDLSQILSQGDDKYIMPMEVYDEIDREVRVHEEKLEKARKKERLRHFQFRNNQPIIPGKWRKEPFPPREYVKLTDYVMTDSIPPAEAETLAEQLITPLNGYLGQAYNYDDHGLTEEWMLMFKDKKTTGPSGDDVVKTQLSSLLEIMIVQVQDRVCTEEKVLEKEPLVLGIDVKEIPVWGIDCYTRTMIELAITEHIPSTSPAATKHFVEKVLLPSINAQDPSIAHDIKYALQNIQVEHKDDVYGQHAQCVLDTLGEFGAEHFKIHPKGTGVVCIRPEGIPAHVLVTMYLGEVYPPYRWCERLDVIEQAQKHYELKPTLPDFYNILLERPRQDPKGYGLLYVDASQKANIGSSCSHSCDSNCTSAVVARNGKLTIALTTNRHIYYGEELTMDYFSITTSDVEWRAAICLCGMATCRGSFLHYATQDDLQQVLNQNFGPTLRYASLLRACAGRGVSKEDMEVMSRHGVHSVAIGLDPPQWMTKYIADILRFIEYERKALPCSLLRTHGSNYSYSAADMEARCIMEQRIQSTVCCISMVNKVLSKQPELGATDYPLVALHAAKAVQIMWNKFKAIPDLISNYMLKEKGLEEHKECIIKVLTDLRAILNDAHPLGFNSLREKTLEIKDILTTISQIPCSKARVSQLSDLLVLWAFTTNFSRPREYKAVQSDPIKVNARELGTHIPRNKIFKPVKDELRKPLRSSKDTTSQNTSQTAVDATVAITSIETITEVAEESHVMDISVDTNTTIESEDSAVIVKVAEEMDENAMEIDSVKDSLAPMEDVTVESLAEASDVSPKADSKVRLAGSISGNKPGAILSPNESVYEGMKTYSSLFCFWQLIGWFNAGSDQKVDQPDLFGCVQLPPLESCFGPSEMSYGETQRKQLLDMLCDEKLQIMPWNKNLKSSFNLSVINNNDVLFGSPMLDTALGQVDAVKKVLKNLITSPKDLKSSKKKKFSRAEEALQLDNTLPPEKPTSWVQCEACKKWRRVPWHVDVEALGDPWQCPMNTWDLENATCEAAQDGYDPATENTIDIQGDVEVQEVKIEDYKLGEWRDVYCLRNKVYYEGQVKKIKPASKKKKHMVLFHYRGWSSSFDEWIEFDSDRIAPHNLYTNPDATDPRDQELWQGMEPVQAIVRSAVCLSSGSNKKRKSGEGAGSESKSPRKISPSS